MIYPRLQQRPLTSDATHLGSRRHGGASHPGVPTAWAQLARTLLEFAQRHGLCRQAVLAAGGIDDRALHDHAARIPLASYFDMLEKVASATDEHLGLHLALEQRDGIELLGFRLLTSDTFAEALGALVRFQRLLYDGQPYQLTREADVTVITIAPCGSPHPGERHLVELLCHVLAPGGPSFFGCPIEGARIELRAPRTAFGRTFLEAFDGRVRFGAGADRVLIPEASSTQTLPGANPAMRAYFERQIHAILSELPPPTLIEQARAFIERNLEHGPGLHDVAGALGLSARTMQRRLRQQGATVRALVDDARKACAAEALLETGSVALAAQRLGYSEPSVFHRAFKRWTGRTPGELSPT